MLLWLSYLISTLACHQMLIRMEHKESFHAFQLKTIQCNESKTMLKNLSTIDDFLSPDEFEFAVESCPLLGIIHKLCGQFLDIFEPPPPL